MRTTRGPRARGFSCLARGLLRRARSAEYSNGRVRVPLGCKGGTQQRTRTVKVGFRRTGRHLEPLSDLGEAELVHVMQEHHRAQPGW